MIPYAYERELEEKEIRAIMRKTFKKMVEERKKVKGCSSANKKQKSGGDGFLLRTRTSVLWPNFILEFSL